MSSERKDYRAARRAFIASCEAARVDAIARVQPGQAVDGNPLFVDTAALGGRLETRAVLVASNDTKGSKTQIALMKAAPPPPGERLVLVHALDPQHFGGPVDPVWAATILTSVATEDLSRVTVLTVMDLTGGGLEAILRRILPKAEITVTAF
jgi:hypothetical protein